MKNFIYLLAIFCVLPLSAAETSPLTPDAFSYRAAIRLPAAQNAAYYRLNLPLSVYQQAQQSSLQDLRIFNLAGQAVPYAWQKMEPQFSQQVQVSDLPWFPLYANTANSQASSATPDWQVNIQQSTNGQLIAVQTKPQARQTLQRRGYVLDASLITNPLSVQQLTLNWAQNIEGFQRLDIEASDDLQHWQPIQTGVQLARLHYNGAQIEHRKIDLNGLSGRYLRLWWQAPFDAPDLTQAQLQQTSQHWQTSPLLWSAPISNSPLKIEPIATQHKFGHQTASLPALKEHQYYYSLSHALPIRALRFTLPEGNILLPVQVFVKNENETNWSLISENLLYRIQDAGQNWTQDSITLPSYTPALKEWMIHIDTRASALTRAPSIAYAIQPEQIIFLASGQAPYQLAIGHPDAPEVALSATTLIPNWGNQHTPQILDASLDQGIIHKIIAPITPVSVLEIESKKLILWAVLVLGVALMAGMAWQLLRKIQKE